MIIVFGLLLGCLLFFFEYVFRPFLLIPGDRGPANIHDIANSARVATFIHSVVGFQVPDYWFNTITLPLKPAEIVLLSVRMAFLPEPSLLIKV